MAADSEKPLDQAPVSAPAPDSTTAVEAAAPSPVAAAPVEAPVSKASPITPVAKPAPVAKSVPAAKAVAPVKAAKPVRAKRKLSAPVVKPVAQPVAAAPVAKAAPVQAAKRKPARPAIKRNSTPPKAAPVSRPLPLFKDKTMAAQAFDFTAAFKTAITEMQDKAKTAYEKGSVAITEANDFAKGNVEAVVESGKILASGLQEMSTAAVADSRAAFESLTAEVKSLASVKSPTEFFQLQSALLRKHFDAAVAQTSKSTEAMLKLANESVAPLSNRVTLAVEKISKVA